MFNLKQFFMQKKNLFASAVLMLCTLFVFTGCKEVMSSLDNPVNSYFKLTETSTKIYRGQSYQIKYTTISDAKPIFKSSDEKIALVDENGVVTGANRGTAKISVELPATDYYNGASAEFTVEVDALLNLPLDAKELALNEEYNLGVTSVSTGAITYKSSDTKVATVDAAGNVTAKGYGDATITISIAATPEYDRTETAEFAATVRIQDITQFNAALAAIEDGGEGTLLLGKDAIFAYNANVDFANKKLTILGEEKNPAIFNYNGSLKIKRGLIIKNAIFNFTGNGNVNFIAVQDLGTAPKIGTSAYYPYEPIIFENLTFNNHNACLIKGKGKIAFSDIQVNNCKIGMKENCNSGVFNFDGGYPEDLKLTNSIVWSKGNGHVGYLFTGSGKPADVSSEAIASFAVDNCILYKIGVGKKVNNGNNIRGKKVLHISLTNTMCIDFGTNVGNEINGWLFGQNSTNPTRVYKNNGYFTSGGAVVPGWTNSSKAGYDDSGTSISTMPSYKDPENGDFSM
jgi:hypothetical protein